MAAAVAPRRSLDVESSRSPSVATQNAPASKTLKRMFQDTLRVTGLSRQRARDNQQSPTPPTERRKDKDRDKPKPQDETKRNLKFTFTRKPKLSLLGGANDAEDRPFMGSLRHASMSSPVLPLFSNPIISTNGSSANLGSTSANYVTPVRPRAYSRRSSTSRDRDKDPITSLQISRPRALAPASPTSPTFPHHPNKAVRGVSPSPQRKQSPPPRITRFPSISTSNLPSSNGQRTVSPTYYSRNTSTTSLNASSPHRETIRIASSLLIKHLSRPPPTLHPQDWQDVEVRLRALSRLERIWGKSGGGGSSTTAVNSGSTFGGGEERERRLFCETVRDGYVLCALLNKFRPGTIARPDPKEDGFAKTSNVTKFLAGALHYGISNADLFMRNDLLEATSESLGRVAQTIIALVKIGEPALPSSDGGRSIYMSTRDGTASSPNLPNFRSRSPPSRSGQQKRYSPPSALAPVPGSSSGKPATPISNGTRQSRSNSMSGRPNDSPQEAIQTSSASAPLPPPRSPLRSTISPRVSVTSTMTESTTGFSLLDNRASARFATMRSGTTEATSIHPSETSSIIGTRMDSKTGATEPSGGEQSLWSHQTHFTDLPSTNRRRSYDREASAARLAAAAQSAPLDVSPTRLRRERRSSDLLSPDLFNVEEVDEMGTRRGRPFVDMDPDWSGLNSTSAPAASPRRPSFDRPRVSFENPLESPSPGFDLSTTPPKVKAGLPMRRPLHGHRHSVDTVSAATTLLPVPRHSSLNRGRDGQPSPSSSRESSTPSPPTGASRPSLVPRKSTSRPSPRPSYVPKLNGVDDARRKHPGESGQIETSPSALAPPRVPFPRSTSGDFVIATTSTGSAGLSRLAPLPASAEAALPEDATTADSAKGSILRNISPQSGAGRPAFPRGRYNSELDTTGTRARKQRPNSLDDGGVRPGRSRFESMINLGTVGDALNRDSSLSINAIRQPLIVREEGKPPMHYQIGNGIGRGQFGAVYRALNLNTGQMVAVKRIGLQDLSEDEISNLMKEVDVLKRLSHPSIVKYEGMVRSTDTLSIVLEYVENGSLGQTIKAFGKLNERLVASYVTKILEGLHYLHTSHVVHCDLKAANILTTKNGNVKLSDFGVSLNLHAKALEEIKNDVAGTPNWMAPEVIELKGPSTASDIWSLGCTTIELLTGHPPYHEIHNGLSVMFRIVEDSSPPIPEICSPLMEDFLKQCFKKNPKERPSAEMLFEHPWLKTAWGEHKELRPQDSIPFLRRVSVELARSEGRGLAVDTRPAISLTDSPRESSELGNRTPASSSQPAPLTPLSPNSPEGLVRNHSFIKTTFGRAVLCRVCLQSVKRSAVLCEECGLIAHARCAADAPASCDIRTQLLLYSQYSQASFVQEVSTPTESTSPAASAPIPIPGSPPTSPRKRRQSEATFSSSPKLSERLLGPWKRSNKSPEPASPPLAPVSGPSSYQYHPPRDETPTPTPAGPSSGRSPILLGSSPNPEKMRKRSRLSFQSTNKTDSMRSMVTAAETVSSSTPSYDSTPRSSVPPTARRQQVPPMSPTLSASGHAATEEGTRSNTRRLGTRASAVSTNASEFGEERKRLRRVNPRDSVSSKDSQCIIQ